MNKILLIEDDPFLVDIYVTKLKESGFLVEAAVDGQEGLKKIEEKKFDLILLDIVLPVIDGWEFLKKLSNSKNAGKLKVIILSNLGQRGEVEKGLKLGAAKYLIKAHYTPSEVIKEVKKILK